MEYQYVTVDTPPVDIARGPVPVPLYGYSPKTVAKTRASAYVRQALQDDSALASDKE